jgi:hypothetical protein
LRACRCGSVVQNASIQSIVRAVEGISTAGQDASCDIALTSDGKPVLIAKKYSAHQLIWRLISHLHHLEHPRPACTHSCYSDVYGRNITPSYADCCLERVIASCVCMLQPARGILWDMYLIS